MKSSENNNVQWNVPPEDGEDSAIITMIDENGEDQEFIVIASVRNNDSNYILVADKELEDNDEAEAVILKEVSAEDGDHVYEIIEDDTEFEKVAALFQNSNEDYDMEV